MQQGVHQGIEQASEQTLLEWSERVLTAGRLMRSCAESGKNRVSRTAAFVRHRKGFFKISIEIYRGPRRCGD